MVNDPNSSRLKAAFVTATTAALQLLAAAVPAGAQNSPQSPSGTTAQPTVIHNYAPPPPPEPHHFQGRMLGPKDVVDGCTIPNRSLDVLAICEKEIAEVRQNLANDLMRHSQAWHNRLQLVLPRLGSDKMKQIESGLDRNNEKAMLENLARLRRLEAAEAYHRTHAEQQLRDG